MNSVSLGKGIIMSRSTRTKDLFVIGFLYLLLADMICSQSAGALEDERVKIPVPPHGNTTSRHCHHGW